MSFAQKMKKVADDLLVKFDERTDKIMLVRPGSKAFNVSTGEYEFTGGETVPITGVVTTYDNNMIDGTTVQSGDKRLISTANEVVSNDDKVILDGVEHSVVSVSPYAYTGDSMTIAFEAQLRR